MRKGIVTAMAMCLGTMPVFAGDIELRIFDEARSAQDVSADGSVVMLWDFFSTMTFLWTAEDGVVEIGVTAPQAPAYGLSADGTTVIGSRVFGGMKSAALWTAADGWQSLGGVGSSCDNSESSGYGINGDGTVAVGLAWVPNCKAHASKWTAATGMQTLPIDGPFSARANCVSDDGQIIGGWDNGPTGARRATLWHADGTQQIFGNGEVFDINSDGTLAVGSVNGEAFYWTPESGVVQLGLLPNPGPFDQSTAIAASEDGSVIVGTSGDPADLFTPLRSFIWTPDDGMLWLDQMLTEQGVDLGDFRLEQPHAVSADGTVIVGGALDIFAFDYSGFMLTLAGSTEPCVATADCADLDADGIRDDNCTWWSCDGGACNGTDIVFGDMGGQFGDCQPDGTADSNDRFHALNCFANVATDGTPGYPCEASSPAAFNVDAGGAFGDCNPDGVCDGNDAFHALNAFEGGSSCSCPSGGPAPVIDPDTDVIPAHVALSATRSAIRPGEFVDVDVILDTPVADLRGYQLHVDSIGGDSGQLELVDIAIRTVGKQADRAFQTANASEHAFAGLGYWDAYNVDTRQMLAGIDADGIAVEAGTYLATFTFKASKDASGAFNVQLLHDADDVSNRSYLFGTAGAARMVITESTDATIAIQLVRRGFTRRAR